MSIGVYNVVSRLARPILRRHLERRLAAGREDGERIGERMGRPSVARPAGPLVWLHAASVGEALSLLSVIERLGAERPRLTPLITTGTTTSASVLSGRLPPTAIHQYIPLDCQLWARSFLDHWKPDAALWSESEFWPAILSETRRRRVPAILLNARVSDRSWRRWRRVPWFIQPLLQTFEAILAQSELDAERLRDLGARNVRYAGNLKFAALPPPAEPEQLAELQASLGDRPRWLAFSTHPGEEEIVLEAHARLAETVNGLVTILVPRHPHRGDDVAALLERRELKAARRSRSEAVERDTEILLGDTIGELGLFFCVAEISLVGGSLVSRGGQNLLEPAKLGSAVLHGPHMENFLEIRDLLRSANAVAEVAEIDDIVRAVSELLLDPSLRRARIEGASRVLDSQSAVLDAVFVYLDEHLDRLDSATTEPSNECA